MPSVLITGGSGFLGGLLIRKLVESGFDCVNIDLQPDDFRHPALTSVQGDIRDKPLLESLFEQHSFKAVFHVAAMLAHGSSDDHLLWTSNVDGTRNVAEAAARHRVGKVVFTSTNCLWGESMGRPVDEEETPKPIELYGRSKWEGEKILFERSGDFDAVVIRCPTIIDSGRLGLLTILFDFIAEGRRVWVVGDGSNRYQFIYAQDLIDAMIRSLGHHHSDIFGIGSDDVEPLGDVYRYVIRQAGTDARVASLPKGLTLAGMKAAYALKVSPLGPYHYKMIAEDFSFRTAKIKEKLAWSPTLTNGQMLFRAYDYYAKNRLEIRNRAQASAHKQAAKMGVIRLLKWVS